MMYKENGNIEEKLACMDKYSLFFYYSDNERPGIMKLKSEFKQRWISAAREKKRPIKRPGRLSLPFDELSDRSKRRKTENLRKTVSRDKLKYTICASLYSSGERNASKILKDITTYPERATKYNQAFHRKQKEINNHNPLDILV